MYLIFVMAALRSLGTPAFQNGLDGLEHNQQIQTNGGVLEVEEVVLKFFERILDATAVLVLYLRPTGKARPHHVAHPVKRDLFREHLHKFRTFRPRADEGHIALDRKS